MPGIVSEISAKNLLKMHGWVKISPLENTPISPNRIGRNFGNLLVFVSSFMDYYRTMGFQGAKFNFKKRGAPDDIKNSKHFTHITSMRKNHQIINRLFLLPWRCRSKPAQLLEKVRDGTL